MSSRERDERELEAVVVPRLRSWLAKAKEAVLKPFRDWGGMPDGTAVYGLAPEWNRDVDTILTTIGKIALGAWSEATDVPPVSRHAFIMASLAQSQNFLVRIPDEVAHLVFAEITEAVNGGKSVPETASEVEAVLTYTGNERWEGRARTIAQTEVTRARNAGTLAAGTEQARVTGRVLNKVWRASHDERVRLAHHEADGQTVPFWAPFMVAGIPMM